MPGDADHLNCQMGPDVKFEPSWGHLGAVLGTTSGGGGGVCEELFIHTPPFGPLWFILGPSWDHPVAVLYLQALFRSCWGFWGHLGAILGWQEVCIPYRNVLFMIPRWW